MPLLLCCVLAFLGQPWTSNSAYGLNGTSSYNDVTVVTVSDCSMKHRLLCRIWLRISELQCRKQLSARWMLLTKKWLSVWAVRWGSLSVASTVDILSFVQEYRSTTAEHWREIKIWQGCTDPYLVQTGMYGYRAWFSDRGSWVLNRGYNFTVLCSVLNRLSFCTGSLQKSVKVNDERSSCVVPKLFYQKI